MKKGMIITILLNVSFIFILSVTKVDAFDPEAVLQVSERIAEWKLLNKDKTETEGALPVYVSSALSGMVEKGIDAKVGVVIGLALALVEPYTPVNDAIDFYDDMRDSALSAAQPDNWVWQGLKATGYDIAGKYIEHFPGFSPVSIERHTVISIDPMHTYTFAQQAQASIGLVWDVGSPFAASGLKHAGTGLLKGQLHNAATAGDFIQLHRATVNLSQGIKVYETIGDANTLFEIGADAFNLSHDAMQEFPAYREPSLSDQIIHQINQPYREPSFSNHNIYQISQPSWPKFLW